MAVNQIFNLKNTTLASWRQGDQDKAYPQWLRDNGVWIKDNAWKFDVTGTVYFPADGYYNFKFTADNYARFSIDGYDLPESNDFTKIFSEIVWVTAGNHTIRCRASDKGNTARSCAMIIDDDTQLVRVWNLMTNGKTNWQNNPVNIVRQPTQSNYCKLMNDNGVWISDSATFDNTWMVDFPVDAYYNFRGAIDDLGQAWVDGQQLADISGFSKEYNTTKFVTAGRKAVRVAGNNNKGGFKGVAFVIEGSIKDLVDAKASANSAKAAENKAAADLAEAQGKFVEAKWIVVPVESVTLKTDFPGGFSASATAEAKASAEAGAGAGYTSTGAQAHIGASAGVGVSASASVGNEYVGCDVRVWVSVEAVSEAHASAGLDGNNVYATAGVNCTVRAEAGTEVSIHAGPAGADGNGCVYVESGTKAEMVVEVGQNGAKLEGGMSIGSCVGAEGEGTVTFSGASGTAGAGATAGYDHFELGAGGQSQFKDGHLCLGIKGEAAAYVGLEVDLAVDIDTNKCIKDAVTVYRTRKVVYENCKQVYNNAVSLSNQAQSQLTNLIGSRANDTAKTFTDVGYAIEGGIVKTGGKIADSCTDAAGKAVKFVSGGKKKIVCTMMNDEYGFGSYRNAIWLHHSANMPEADVYQRGYHTLFLPLVAYARGTGVTNHWVKKALEHIARHRTRDIYLETKGRRRSPLGRVYRAVLEPLCYVVGKIT
jgi:hypothetical protein